MKQFILAMVLILTFFMMSPVSAEQMVTTGVRQSPGMQALGYHFVKTPVSDSPDIQETITNDIGASEVDTQNYTVVHRTRIDSLDGRTGILHTHIVVLEEATLDEASKSMCGSGATVHYSCYYKKSRIRTDTDIISFHGRWISSNARHYYRVYCRGAGDCIYSKPTKLKIWWERNNTAWTVMNANVKWGCTTCIKCQDGDFNFVYSRLINSVGWASQTKSWVYIYTSSSWPSATDWDMGFWRAGSTSKTYFNGTYKGRLSTNASP